MICFWFTYWLSSVYRSIINWSVLFLELHSSIQIHESISSVSIRSLIHLLNGQLIHRSVSESIHFVALLNQSVRRPFIHSICSSVLVYQLISRRRFQQMDVLEGQNILVTISGKKSKIRVYYLSWLKTKIFKADGVSFKCQQIPNIESYTRIWTSILC